MAIMHPAVRDEFRTDLGLVQDQVRSGVVESTAKKAESAWDLWLGFCASLPLDPYFSDGGDPIPYLQVFAARYRDGRIAPRGKPVRSGTVSAAVRHVGQTYARMGTTDIRLDAVGNLDFRLSRMFRGYTRQDPPPGRVRPVPIQVVVEIVRTTYHSTVADWGSKAIADMICLGFFYLLRPGEYTYAKDNTPFHLKDVTLHIGSVVLDLNTATIPELDAATAASLTFTTQKNGVKGEKITQGRSGDPLVCPVKTLVRRVKALRQQNLPGTTPLCSYKHRNRVRHVVSTNVRDALRQAITVLGTHTLDIRPTDVEARSLRAGGATAMLVAGIDSNIIQLVGRWKSDAMLRYLHVSANPAMRQYAAQMFHQGSITFNPGTTVPQY